MNAGIQVSVIIPAYNAADTLEKAVRSALAQTLRAIEIIIIDDCSKDDTYVIAHTIAATDERIHVLRLSENSGKPYAVNYATARAKGKWIAILDADDWYAPERLETLVRAAEASGVDMVADNHFLFDVHANAFAGTMFPRRGQNYSIGLDEFLELSDPTKSYDYGMLKPVFRADFIRRHSIEYYEPARVGEDYYILLCFFVAGGKALICDEAYYYYTQPFGTISRKWAQEGRKPYNFELIQKVHEHFVEVFGDKLSSRQLQKLTQRGQAISAFIYFYQVKECVAHKDIAGAIKNAIKAPARFWTLIIKRIYMRIARNVRA